MNFPKINSIKKAREILGNRILTTPVVKCHCTQLTELLGPNAQVWCKFEIWQYTGSFKARAALLTLSALTFEQRQKGVIAISAGNHGIAVAWAARQFSVNAKILMPKTAPKIRIEKCKQLGAEVVLFNNMEEVFEKVDEFQKSEPRILIHPFEGEQVALGTGTLAVELNEQLDPMDFLLVGVGGGGLIGGISNAYKQLNPNIKIIGIEPEESAVMRLSFQQGQPMQCCPKSIADSLCAPRTEPYTFALCYQFVDQIVTISETEILSAMRFLFYEMKLAVEPAAAVSMAALMGKLAPELYGKKIIIILSGSNIDYPRYCELINNSSSRSSHCLNPAAKSRDLAK